MKRYILVLLAIEILLGIMTSIYEASDMFTVQKEGMKAMGFEELATLSIDQTYDYEDVLEDQYINGLISKEEITELKSQHSINNYHTHSHGSVRYAKFTMDDYIIPGTVLKYVLTPIFYVGLYYTEDSAPDTIVSLDEPYIQTSKGVNCIFAGNIFYRIESGNSLYYGVYGDVYRTSTLTKIGLPVSDIFIKNVDFDGRYYSPALNS